MFHAVTIIGVGLIGGSLGLALKKRNLAHHIIGVSRTKFSAEKALELGLVDKILPLKEAVQKSELIYVAVPPDATLPTIKKVLNIINKKQTVVDACSVKGLLCKGIQRHINRQRFVASHPMWGTEHSGPEAAVKEAFSGKACIICEKEKSDADALRIVEKMYHAIGMHLLHMDTISHDIYTAYISHISHVTSFALANTVLAKKVEEHTIFELAGSGFESTTRLAKSSPTMWVPLLMENRKNVLNVLDEHIMQLQQFKICLEKKDQTLLQKLIEQANYIKKIIP